MGVSVPVCLPSPDAGTHSGEQTSGVGGQDAADSSLLERRTLVANAVGTTGRHATPSPQPAGPPDQHIDGVSGEEPGQSSSCGMAAMRQATGLNLPPSAFSTVQNSWRKGTRCQYQSAWRMWCKWCADQRVDRAAVSVDRLLLYLQQLVDKGFAWRTVNVHRSAISSILQPNETVPVGQHPLVCRFLKGVFNLRPPPVSIIPTWDVGRVLSLLAEWHSASDISLERLAKKAVVLLALCTAKRVSDLVLFSVDEGLCYVGTSSVVLQTRFGSKTDRPLWRHNLSHRLNLSSPA